MELNPREILDHLKSYGISSIDKENFKYFLKDLKKLIKYEGRQKQTLPLNSKNNLVDFTDVSTQTCTSPIHAVNSGNSKSNCNEQMHDVDLNDEIDNCKRHLPCKCNFKLSSTCYKNFKPLDNKENLSSPSTLKFDVRSSSGLSSQKLTCRASYRNQRKISNDPVTLYHYYQSIWKRHKLPGENDHAHLRREIRQRLMPKQ